MTAPRAQNLPKLQQNRVVQLSLGATEAALSKGLPARARVSESKKPAVAEVFVVEKIIDKRRVKSKVEYLVVWEGYTSEHNSWEPISSFKGRSRAIDDFESTHIPPHCVKNGNDVCSCGDTGCDGPGANYNDHSVSSSSSSATVTQKQVPAEASVAVVTKQVCAHREQLKLFRSEAGSSCGSFCSSCQKQFELFHGDSEAGSSEAGSSCGSFCGSCQKAGRCAQLTS